MHQQSRMYEANHLQVEDTKTNFQQMWSSKSTDRIYGHKKALTLMKKNPTEAAAQAMRAKYLLGAVKYMRSKTIEGYFAEQKKRIGTALDEIDNALPGVTPNGGMNAWQKQDLKKKWDAYMDDAFDMAKKRTDNTMTFFLNNLQTKWGNPAKAPAGGKGKTTGTAGQKDLARQIKALRTQWTKTKISTWTKPNW